MNSSEVSSFFFGAVSCSLAVGTVIWQVFSLKLKGELSDLKHDLQMKDKDIENLNNVQILLNNGLDERFKHFSSRVKIDISKIDDTVKQMEFYLSKSTTYETRK